MRHLYKTTVVIWSDYDTQGMELLDLAYQSTEGDMYCSIIDTIRVEDPEDDIDWDGTEFFTEPHDDYDDDIN